MICIKGIGFIRWRDKIIFNIYQSWEWKWIDWFFLSLVSINDSSFSKDRNQLSLFSLSYSNKSFRSGIGTTIPWILGSMLLLDFNLADLEDRNTKDTISYKKDIEILFKS